MATIDYPHFTVEFNDDSKTKDAVFDAVLAFFKKHQNFSGEGICQSDAPIIDAPNLLSDLADEVIGFKVTWKE